MNNNDFEFTSGTENYRNFSILCIFLSLFLMILHEIEIMGILDWEISSTPAIVVGLMAVALRLAAIDRFLRMCNQLDYEEKHPKSEIC